MMVMAVLREFEEWFGQLQALDQPLFGLDGVMLLLKVVDMKNARDLGTFIQDENSATSLFRNRE